MLSDRSFRTPQPIRIAFRAAGIDFEDKRLSYADFGAAKKAGQYPTGVPVLQQPDGRTITQSLAMLRYAGRLGQLYPSDPADGLAVDEVLDVCADVLTRCPQDKDPEVKKAKRAEYGAGAMKRYFDLLNARLARTDGALGAVDLNGGVLACMVNPQDFGHAGPVHARARTGQRDGARALAARDLRVVQRVGGGINLWGHGHPWDVSRPAG